MVSKNNLNYLNEHLLNSDQKFKIKKLSVGVASVLIGMTVATSLANADDSNSSDSVVNTENVVADPGNTNNSLDETVKSDANVDTVSENGADTDDVDADNMVDATNNAISNTDTINNVVDTVNGNALNSDDSALSDNNTLPTTDDKYQELPEVYPNYVDNVDNLTPIVIDDGSATGAYDIKTDGDIPTHLLYTPDPSVNEEKLKELQDNGVIDSSYQLSEWAFSTNLDPKQYPILAYTEAAKQPIVIDYKQPDMSKVDAVSVLRLSLGTIHTNDSSYAGIFTKEQLKEITDGDTFDRKKALAKYLFGVILDDNGNVVESSKNVNNFYVNSIDEYGNPSTRFAWDTQLWDFMLGNFYVAPVDVYFHYNEAESIEGIDVGDIYRVVFPKTEFDNGLKVSKNDDGTLHVEMNLWDYFNNLGNQWFERNYGGGMQDGHSPVLSNEDNNIIESEAYWKSLGYASIIPDKLKDLTVKFDFAVGKQPVNAFTGERFNVTLTPLGFEVINNNLDEISKKYYDAFYESNNHQRIGMVVPVDEQGNRFMDGLLDLYYPKTVWGNNGKMSEVKLPELPGYHAVNANGDTITTIIPSDIYTDTKVKYVLNEGENPRLFVFDTAYFTQNNDLNSSVFYDKDGNLQKFINVLELDKGQSDVLSAKDIMKVIDNYDERSTKGANFVLVDKNGNKLSDVDLSKLDLANVNYVFVNTTDYNRSSDPGWLDENTWDSGKINVNVTQADESGVNENKISKAYYYSTYLGFSSELINSGTLGIIADMYKPYWLTSGRTVTNLSNIIGNNLESYGLTDVMTGDFDKFKERVNDVLANNNSMHLLAYSVDDNGDISSKVVGYWYYQLDDDADYHVMFKATDNDYAGKVSGVYLGNAYNGSSIAPGGQFIAFNDLVVPTKVRKVTINYVDERTNDIVFSRDIEGNVGQKPDLLFGTDIKDLESKGYVFVSSGIPNDFEFTVDKNDQVFKVIVKHGTQTVVSEPKEFTATVNYVVDGDSTIKLDSNKQTISFTQTGKKDLVTGDVTWNNDWILSGNGYKKVESPSLEGYVPDKQTVLFENLQENQEVTVMYDKVSSTVAIYVKDDLGNLLNTKTFEGKYNDSVPVDVNGIVSDLEAKGYKVITNNVPKDPKFLAENKEYVIVVAPVIDTVNDEKVITRTIELNKPTGLEKVVQSVTLTRTGKKNLVNGDIEWENWSEGQFDSYIVPVIDGYKSSIDSIDKQVVTGDTEDSVIIVDYIEDKVITVNDEKAVTRTIILKKPTGDESIVQKAVLTRQGTYLESEGKDTTKWSDWSQGSFDEFSVPQINGYKSSIDSIDKQVVTGDTEDSVITVNYIEDKVITVNDEKTVTRTIILKKPTGDESIVQKAVLTRQGTYLESEGKDTTKWSDWSQGSFNEFSVPQINGYKSSIDSVDKQVVTGDTEDSVVTVDYTKLEDKNIIDSTDRVVMNDEQKVVDPGTLLNNNNKVVTTTPVSVTDKQVAHSDNSTFNKEQSEKELPQTGDKDESLMALGVIALAMSSSLMLLDKKKRV